ncbi:MAG: polyprenyl synthetase family protein, partial [Bdellovibrionales bacterium]|nr:polyprenyl synthetase family protein [Bdellovibrionales bacterium]NQZ19061.1 polyprenyl synthetase family protein [Bdellovibrionales bacterium]
DVALLAGDSLLTEAFSIVAKAYTDNSSKLVLALAEAAGWKGMIRGQVLDIGQGDETKNLENLIHLHELKTGQLIALCFKGPALMKGLEPESYYKLGLMLGLAFQIKDDILDADEDGEASFISFLGLEKTKEYLADLTQDIESLKAKLGLNNTSLDQLISFNLNRNI